MKAQLSVYAILSLLLFALSTLHGPETAAQVCYDFESGLSGFFAQGATINLTSDAYEGSQAVYMLSLAGQPANTLYALDMHLGYGDVSVFGKTNVSYGSLNLHFFQPDGPLNNTDFYVSLAPSNSNNPHLIMVGLGVNAETRVVSEVGFSMNEWIKIGVKTRPGYVALYVNDVKKLESYDLLPITPGRLILGGSGGKTFDLMCLENVLSSTFTAGISVSSGADSATLSIGQAAGATDAIDTAQGEEEVPPAPPAGVFDVRLVLPDGVTGSLVDVRTETDDPVSWKLKFQPGAAGYPIDFTWNPSALPPGRFALKDEITGTIIDVDMRQQSAYSLTNTGITTLLVEHSDQIISTVNMEAGWNLISVPVEATDMTVGALFPGATSSAFGFSDGYVTINPLTTARGYWLKYGSAFAVSVTGLPVVSQNVPVSEGWNMIGTFDAPATVASVTSTPTGIVSTNFFGFSGAYFTASSLNPGEGYWVKTSQAGTLHLGSSGKQREASEWADWPALRFEDAADRAAGLYLKEGDLDRVRYELPPVPPSGAFDVRFVGGRFAASLNTDAEIAVREAVYPLAITGSNLGERVLQMTSAGTGEATEVREDTPALISEYGGNLLLKMSKELPAEFVLHQNYPNPFNPATQIGFALPERSEVEIAVRDVLGRDVASLVNGPMDAGRHEVRFDGYRLSSGVYVYVMRAGDFRESRTMLLVK